MMGVKSKGDPGPTTAADQKAVNYSITMSSYSRDRYSKVHQWDQFKTLFNYIYTQTPEGSEKSCFEILWDSEEKLLRKERARYTAAFSEMYERCRD